MDKYIKFFIGLDEDGWIKYTETVEFGQYANGTQLKILKSILITKNALLENLLIS
ncbi:hypothetical protein NNC19_16340 [Clostridium sp. SHJSY1]|uniref:hypothetical protein n=1 Tax=Clostridium sp. SHJSY1 TaxID=2942483 RepID=UPI002875515A|nr:hypothetical protein [Clostridium sp. SHJSY1]MDS0527261.1 hypothetical protein [Clostridium sp. SHJSY1]